MIYLGGASSEIDLKRYEYQGSCFLVYKNKSFFCPKKRKRGQIKFVLSACFSRENSQVKLLFGLKNLFFHSEIESHQSCRNFCHKQQNKTNLLFALSQLSQIEQPCNKNFLVFWLNAVNLTERKKINFFITLNKNSTSCKETDFQIQKRTYLVRQSFRAFLRDPGKVVFQNRS